MSKDGELDEPIPPALVGPSSSAEHDIAGSRNAWWNIHAMNQMPHPTEESSYLSQPPLPHLSLLSPLFHVPPLLLHLLQLPLLDKQSLLLFLQTSCLRERKKNASKTRLQNHVSQQKHSVQALNTSSSLSFSSSICLRSSSALFRSSAFLFSSACFILSSASFRVLSYSFSKRLFSCCAAASCYMFRGRWVTHSRCLNFLNYAPC